MKDIYYHITALENIDCILKDGLKCNEDGKIYLFEDASVITQGIGVTENNAICYGRIRTYVEHYIARCQLLLEVYALFRVDLWGIDGELVNDDCAECTSRFQWMARQKSIEPGYIELVGIFYCPKFNEIVEPISELTAEQRTLFYRHSPMTSALHP